MDQKTRVSQPVRRTSPLQEHRRQMVWKVWVPLAASIVIVLALMVLTILGAVNRSPAIDKWGAISAIYVIIPVLIVGLLILGLIGGMIFLLSRLLKNMPRWAVTLHMIFIRIALLTRRAADAVVKPVVSVNKAGAGTRALWRHYFK